MARTLQVTPYSLFTGLHCSDIEGAQTGRPTLFVLMLLRAGGTLIEAPRGITCRNPNWEQSQAMNQWTGTRKGGACWGQPSLPVIAMPSSRCNCTVRWWMRSRFVPALFWACRTYSGVQQKHVIHNVHKNMLKIGQVEAEASAVTQTSVQFLKGIQYQALPYLDVWELIFHHCTVYTLQTHLEFGLRASACLACPLTVSTSAQPVSIADNEYQRSISYTTSLQSMSTFSLETEGIRPTPGLLLTSQVVLPVVLLGFTRWTCFAHCPSLSTIRIVQENALLKLIHELCSHPPLQWIRGPGMLAVFADLWSLCAEKDVWNDRMVLGVGRRFTHVHTSQARKLFHLRTAVTCADLVAGVIPKLWAAGDPQQLYWTPVSARFLWCASVLW